MMRKLIIGAMMASAVMLGLGASAAAGAPLTPAAAAAPPTTMGISVNLSKALDAAYENSSLEQILAAPPSALAGVTEADDKALQENLGIKTIRDLGSNKYFELALVLVSLSAKTG